MPPMDVHKISAKINTPQAGSDQRHEFSSPANDNETAPEMEEDKAEAAAANLPPPPPGMGKYVDRLA